MQENNDKSDYIKIKIFLPSKENINTEKMKSKWDIFFQQISKQRASI